MRKRIGVFLGEIGREFQKEMVKQIKTLACGKGYDVFVFNNFGSYDSTFLFDSGEQNIIKIPDFTKFDGIISLADTFDIDGYESDLILQIKSQCDCPIVSVRNGSEDTYRIFFDDYQTIYKMTNHFIKKHGFRNICYMSGPFDSADSQERLNGFKDAMKDSGIRVTDDIIFEGDFWKFKCKEAAEYFLNAYNGKVQAIVCANDYMALGLCEEFSARGLKVPKDIAITGFDGVIEGQISNPPLTTVKFPISQMAQRAVELIERLSNNAFALRDNFITGDIVVGGSCGCKFCEPKIDSSALINQASSEYINIRLAVALNSDIPNRITEEEKLSFINTYIDRFGLSRTYLCLNTEDKDENHPFSETMSLRASFPMADNNNILDIKFNRGEILPEEAYDSQTPSCFLVLPIHYKDQTFGYAVFEWENNIDYTRFLAPFMQALSVAYDDLSMQKQYGELVEIRRQNLIDALTGISNRRGYDQNLTNLIKAKNKNTDTISFVSTDMDNLKFINDTFGHPEGDLAIITFARALKEVVADNGFCARMGGDEFAVILTTPDKSFHKNFKKILSKKMVEKTAELNKPYEVHASIGIVTTGVEGLDKTLENIRIADKKMYKDKNEYKKSKG